MITLTNSYLQLQYSTGRSGIFLARDGEALMSRTILRERKLKTEEEKKTRRKWMHEGVEMRQKWWLREKRRQTLRVASGLLKGSPLARTSKANENKPWQRRNCRKPNLVLHFSLYILVHLHPPNTALFSRWKLHTRGRRRGLRTWARLISTRDLTCTPSRNTHRVTEAYQCLRDNERRVNTQWMKLLILHSPCTRFHFPLAVPL